MQANAVVEVLEEMRRYGIAVCVDGGWGVDALVGMQTRPHDDLDLVIDAEDLDRAVEVLVSTGFAITEDERPTRLVLAHPDGQSVDLHPVTFDAEGGGVQQLPGGKTYRYPPQGLRGRGAIAGRGVRCVNAATQLECHQGYEPTAKDRHDIALLEKLLEEG